MSYMNEMQEFFSGNGETAFAEVTVPLCDQTVGHEIVKEIALADYEPDVRRILAVRETVQPPTAYVGGGRAEWSGVADYRLLCVTADGGLCTVNASAEYELQAPLSLTDGGMDMSEGVCLFVTTETDHLSARLSAPRRISLKHRLSSRVRAYGSESMEESFMGDRIEGVHRLWTEGEQMIPSGGLSEPIPFREEIALSSAESRVISADATVFVSSASVGEGAMSVSGEILLKLMADKEGEIEMRERKIPFDGVIESDGFARVSSESRSACASGTVESMTVTVEEGRAVCEGEILLSGRSLCRQPLRYTADLYATECETECEYRTREIPVAIKCENRNMSQNEKLSLQEARVPENAEILDAWGRARAETCEARGDRYVHTGKSRYWILWRKDGETAVSEVELPLRYETEAGEEEYPLGVGDCSMQVISCRARADEETLHIDAEIAVCADYLGSASVRWVSEVRKGAMTDEKRPAMTVYYPAPEDTPWTVAKKYRVPQNDLVGDIGSYFLF